MRWLALLLGLAMPIDAQGAGPRSEVHPPRVWIVDQNGSGDFEQIQPAIDRASDGDAILVRDAPGDYDGFEIVGKGVHVLGQDAFRVSVFGTVRVRAVPEGSRVVVRNLDVESYDDGFVVVVTDTVGGVWLEDLRVRTNAIGIPGEASDGIQLRDASSVVLVQVEVFGSFNQSASHFDPRIALHALRSEAHAFESLFRGPNGTANSLVLGPGIGGTGARIEESTLYAYGCLFEGGRGSWPECLPPPDSGCFGNADGGVGLEVLAPSTVQAVECVMTGGAGGGPVRCGFPCGESADGVAVAGDGSLVTTAGVIRTCEATARVPFGGTLSVTVTGLPGEHSYLFSGEDFRPVFVPSLASSFLLAPPFEIITQPLVPASGVLERSFPIPPSLGHTSLFVQAFFLGPGAPDFFTGGSAVLLTSR